MPRGSIPGGVVPAGECPRCGALAYPVVVGDALPDSARATIAEVLEATRMHLRTIRGGGGKLTVSEGLQDVVDGMAISVDKLRLLLGKKPAGRRTWTVVGLYPAGEGACLRDDSFVDHVEAASAAAAEEECVRRRGVDSDPRDIAVIAVFGGGHGDVRGEGKGGAAQ